VHLLLIGVYLAIRGSAMNKRMNPFNGHNGHNGHNCDIEAFIIMMIILIVVFGCVG
jgi:hypothetical protein